MLGLFSVALERTQQGGLSAHLFLLSPHSSPPSGCEDICSFVSLGAGAQEQSMPRSQKNRTDCQS